MRCPRHETELRETEVSGAVVSVCDTCGGMYLHKGELNKVAGPTSGDLEFSTIDGDSFQHDDEYGPIHCPVDTGQQMQKVEFVMFTGIILDYCATCHGFWLDGRELQRIREEVSEYNDAAKEGDEPLLVRLAQFFWELPFPH
jgi:Zn-finger nucleic acid-binding protein